MLADGCADAWNGCNQLASVLCARAIIETAAFFVTFETELSQLCEQTNFTAIDKLVMNRIFATRLKHLQGETSAMVEAVNVLTLIGKLDKKLGYNDNRVLRHYEFLSEFCHPNSYGHTQFFQIVEETATLNFTDKPAPDKSLLRFVLTGFVLTGLIEVSLNKIDSLLPEVLQLSEAARGA